MSLSVCACVSKVQARVCRVPANKSFPYMLSCRSCGTSRRLKKQKSVLLGEKRRFRVRFSVWVYKSHVPQDTIHRNPNTPHEATKLQINRATNVNNECYSCGWRVCSVRVWGRFWLKPFGAFFDSVSRKFRRLGSGVAVRVLGRQEGQTLTL